MKKIVLMPLLFLALMANLTAGNKTPAAAPTANAGPNQTIYLTQTSSVTLNGSGTGSGLSFSWSKVSTDQKDNALISSPNSASTTVSGLVQGTWYYQLTVTDNTGATARSVVVVRVNYDVPPTNGTYVRGLPMDQLAPVINDRRDTTKYIQTSKGLSEGDFLFDRSRLNGLFIDNQNAKFYSTVEDGYGWDGNNYARSEVGYGDYYGIDTSKTYMIEWKGYFPQPASSITGPEDLTVIWQLHSYDGYSPPFGFYADKNGNINWVECVAPSNNRTVTAKVADYSSFYNQTHTIRVVIKEGKSGSGAYVKVLIDGVQKYIRNTGDIGRTWNKDWMKFATVYDWGKAVVDPSNKTRGKKFSLVTESFNVYTLSGNAVTPPSANAGNAQTITLPTNSVNLSGSGTSSNGGITNYSWTKTAGPAGGTITNASSASTTVTGLVEGAYTFELKVTDKGGATAKSSVQITVKAATATAPVANAGTNQTIMLPVSTVTLAGSATSSGTISGYKWSQVSGPAGGTISNATSASTTVSGLVQGVYSFELTVTDNTGATAKATVQVTVNANNNIAPKAQAGPDQTITLPVNSVSFSGTGTDSDGTIASYSWTKFAGPAAGTITNPSSASTTVTGLIKGEYTFQLKVTDNQGAAGTDTVHVTVNGAAIAPPVANAGANQAISLPASSIILTGTGTSSGGTIAGYKWAKVSGPAGGTISNATSASTTVTGLVQGVYSFELTVTDNTGASAKATVQVTVNANNNIAPKAQAGPDQTITLPVNSVSFSGTGTDSDGTIASYSWTKFAGPAAGTITSPSSAATTVTGLVKGEYTFQLKVTDNQGATGTDTVHVRVNGAAIAPPVANAGANQAISLPASSVILTGTGTSSGGTIAGYKWAKVSGPAGGTISNATSASTTVTGLVQGVYSFELTVTDNTGASAKATVQVTVNANTSKTDPPTAQAGPDQTIALPANSVSFTGKGTSTGTITSYSWKKTNGPTATITNPSSASTTVTGLVQGEYTFEFNVTDNSGSTGKDTIHVSVVKVSSPTNNSPIANAGPNRSITLPVNNTTLSGSGTDTDGQVVGYMWTKVSGPTAYNIVNASSAVTDITGLTAGVYIFQLKVTDNLGATGTASVQVTVNDAVKVSNIPPVANAGADITVTLPVSSVSLNGSGTDADGKITAYSWKQISGPAGSTITAPNAATTFVNNLSAGTYQFELTVTDNLGATGKATVTVVVALDKQAPAPASNSINVYPNPVKNVTTLDVSTPKAGANLQIVITDMRGKTVYTKSQVSGTLGTSLKINMANLSKGIYNVTVYFDKKEQQTLKVVKL